MADVRAIADVVGGLAELATANAKSKADSAFSVDDVCAALAEFNECVRYLNTRRSEGAVLQLDSEAAVQDALFLILRPWVTDLVPESPTDRIGNRFSIRDFSSRALRLVVEAKFIRDKQHGKSVSKELHDDIEVYRHLANCETVVFFVYDPDANIPDVRELQRIL